MSVMSLRLSEKELQQIESLAKENHKDKSSVARELLKAGFQYKTLLAYKEGNISLAKLAKTLNMNVSEVIDFLSTLGVPSPLSYDDYLQGFESLRKAIR